MKISRNEAINLVRENDIDLARVAHKMPNEDLEKTLNYLCEAPNGELYEIA